MQVFSVCLAQGDGLSGTLELSFGTPTLSWKPPEFEKPSLGCRGLRTRIHVFASFDGFPPFLLPPWMVQKSFLRSLGPCAARKLEQGCGGERGVTASTQQEQGLSVSVCVQRSHFLQQS